ncbi:hypothetical protein V5O48_006992 [Marasmius crinis-equi]|uniref:Uncharacterized protein n=1 Tax=Marasmius crinis-equi TaxID=585013 RepID=A0ABR3FHX8_9AGAR
MSSSISSATALNDWELLDLLDAINTVHLATPPFTPVTCQAVTYENPAVEGSTGHQGAAEDFWHLVMKPAGCLAKVKQGIYREYEDILAQLPEFKFEENSPLRYRKFSTLVQAKEYWADLQKETRQARCRLLFNEMARLEPDLFPASVVSASPSAHSSANPPASPKKPRTISDKQPSRPAQMSMKGFAIYVVGRVEDIICCRDFVELHEAKTLYHSFVDQQVFSRLYLARKHDDAVNEFEKEERAYNLAIEKVLEGVELSD